VGGGAQASAPPGYFEKSELKKKEEICQILILKIRILI
jgi:hypothetical protein